MGRTPTFDRDTVVRAARAVFWQHGYADASLPMLEEATGLRRSSIYHAFDSKRGLFDAAVDSYLAEIIRPRLRPLLAESVAATALEEYLLGLRAAFDDASSPARDGCLLVNAATAPIGRDGTVAAVVAGYRAELAAAFAAGLRASGRDPQQAAALTGLVIASFALVRVDAASATATLDAALTLVRR